MGRSKMILNLKLKDSKKWICLLAVIIMLSCYVVYLIFVQDYSKRVYYTKLDLIRARNQVMNVKKLLNAYPKSMIGIHKKYKEYTWYLPKEFISDPNGRSDENYVLNGQGGWYYDPKSGEVKVNITKPVKHYLKYYVGKHRNEIPADW